MTSFCNLLELHRQLDNAPARLFSKAASTVRLTGEIQGVVPRRRLANDWRLSNVNDLWYTGGGAFQEGSFGYAGRSSGGHHSLGTVFDISADITLTATTTLTFYGSGIRGGRIQASIYPAGGQNPTARFFYAELTKRF